MKRTFSGYPDCAITEIGDCPKVRPTVGKNTWRTVASRVSGSPAPSVARLQSAHSLSPGV